MHHAPYVLHFYKRHRKRVLDIIHMYHTDTELEGFPYYDKYLLIVTTHVALSPR